MNLRVDHSSEDGEVGYYNDRYAQYSKSPRNNWVRRNDHEVTMKGKRSEFGISYMQKEYKEFESPTGAFSGSFRSRTIMDQWDVERNGSVAFHGTGTGIGERRRGFSTSPYPNEGSSNHQYGSFHGYADQKTIYHELGGPSRVESLELDRAEILRRLDELKFHISRSSDLSEKPRERVLVDRKMAPSPPRPPLYFNHNHQPVPYIDSRDLDVQDFYARPRNVSNEFVVYDGSDMPQRLRSPPPQYLMQPYHDHFSGPHMDFNRSTLASHQHETFSHTIPHKNPHPIVSSRPQNDLANPVFRHLESSVTYSPQFYNSRGTNPPHLRSLDQQSQTRSSIDSDMDIGGVAQRIPRRVVVAHGSEQACHPITGGAPFLTCCRCFKLLKLPRKLAVMGKKKQQKIRCGACSDILLIEFEKKGIVVSVPKTLTQFFSRGDDDVSGEMLNENLQSPHNHLNIGAKNSCSGDYGYSPYKFQLTDTESNVMSSDQRSSFGESNETKEPLSSTSSFSEDEHNQASVIFQKDVSCNSNDLPPKDDMPLPFSDSLHQKGSDSASSHNVVIRHGMGNESKHDDKEKVILDRSTLQQNSAKDVSVATEIEVPFNEFPKSSVSQESTEVSKEEDRPRINKGSEPFLVGLNKMSSTDLSGSSQSAEAYVFINGEPISDRAVEKAETLAGPIEPGKYWYDYQAGFWGVMGQPCLGIIPPFIEQFRYPMPEDCAAGNTRVFVNGRELNQRDLDLLARRGLPTTRDRYFVVDISGRVLDEDTGEELDSLGKLAPTVEKANQGFGMKIPRVLGQRPWWAQGP